MTTLTPVRSLAALSLASLVTACAAPGAMNTPPPGADHHVNGQRLAAAAARPAMEPRMQAMHEMHRRMQAAASPEARQALMAEHMQAMQGGMAMMKDMSRTQHMGMEHAGHHMAAPADSGKAMPMMAGAMARHHALMARRMEAMEAMMAMMLDRMPPAPAAR